MKRFYFAALICGYCLVSANINIFASERTFSKDTVIEQLKVSKDEVVTVSPGKKLTLKSTSTVAGQLILKSGAQIELDFKAPGSLNISSGGLLKIEGTKAKPCQIYAKKGSAVAYISDGGSNGGGRIVASYCIFKNLGGKPVYRAYEYWPNAETGEIKLENCVFDSCYQVKAKYKLPKGAKVSFIGCKWQNSQVKPKSERRKWEEWYIHETSASPGSEGKLINCDFDKTVGLFFPADYVVEGCVFREGVKCYSHWCPEWKSFKENFIRSRSDHLEFSFSFGNKIEDCVFIKDSKGWNPHYLSIQNGTGKGGIYGSVFWFTGPGTSKNRGAEGDGVMLGKAKSGTRADNLFTLARNIVLPNRFGAFKANNLSCTLLTVLIKSDNSSVAVKNNTIFTTGGGGCNLGETQTCEKGRIKAIKSNLYIGNGTGKKIQNLGHSEVDTITEENVDYNAGWKLVNGSNYTEGSGKGYDKFKFSKATILGKHDIDDIDPQFVDVNRNPYSWDKSLGGKGDMQGVMDKLSGGKVIELLKYIREGLRPQNPKLKGAGDPEDGSSDIGAVQLK
jgi:hypothetical protein